jgi:hypothetical protein
MPLFASHKVEQQKFLEEVRMASGKPSSSAYGMYTGVVAVASALLIHMIAAYGSNHGCSASACYFDLSNAPSVRSKTSKGNVTYLGKFPVIDQCESACLAFKVLIDAVNITKQLWIFYVAG